MIRMTLNRRDVREPTVIDIEHWEVDRWISWAQRNRYSINLEAL